MALPSKSRLGRGLSGLLSSTASLRAGTSSPDVEPAEHAPAIQADGLTDLPIACIRVNPNQPRRTFDEAALEELAGSIRINGVLQPVIVRPCQDGYELVAGERRYRAAKRAGLSAIPAIVRDIDAYTQAQWALVENIHRTDLNAIERADAYAALMTQLGLTQAELAGRLGEQRSSVANHLRLLELPAAVRDAIRDGLLSLGHAKVLAGVTPERFQILLTEQCLREGWSVRELEQQAVQMAIDIDGPTPSEALAAAPANAHFTELEHQLAQHLGVRVRLRKGKKQGTGQIVLHYGSLDEFDELVRRWGISFTDR